MLTVVRGDQSSIPFVMATERTAIAAKAPFAVRFGKEAVDRAVSIGLAEGQRLERRLFHLSFATGELHDGMRQFLATRKKR